MDAKLDEFFKNKLREKTAQLQQSKIKSDSFQKSLDHEVEMQKRLIGGINVLQELIEANV